jgi:membrane protease YdiL (CAAX protease family)
MKKLYLKSELSFSLVWIGLYVVVMNIALQFCGGFDDLASKTAEQVLIPVIYICVFAAFSTICIIWNGLSEKYGLCHFKGSGQQFLYFLPLIIMSCINLKNGLGLNAPLAVTLLMMVNLAVAGYVEEIIFRGFLFRCLAKDNLRSAIIVSAVTFGVGHIVNLANTADTLGVLLQVCYAIMIGFLYTIIVYKGGSLWPCIASHMFVNGSSTFALEQGPFSDLMGIIFGQASTDLVQVCSFVFIMVVSGGYALWLWRRAK